MLKSKSGGEKVARVPEVKKVPLQSSSGFNVTIKGHKYVDVVLHPEADDVRLTIFSYIVAVRKNMLVLGLRLLDIK